MFIRLFFPKFLENFSNCPNQDKNLIAKIKTTRRSSKRVPSRRHLDPSPPMEDLPHHLILDILSRLDSPALARTRLVSKTLNHLSRQVTSVSLQWTVPKYLSHLRSPRDLNLTPFKSALKAIILSTPRVERIAYGIDCSTGSEGFVDYEEADDDGDDMYMTDDVFVEECVLRVRDDLRVLKVADFWVQSCWRKSEILALLSFSCEFLRPID